MLQSIGWLGIESRLRCGFKRHWTHHPPSGHTSRNRAWPTTNTCATASPDDVAPATLYGLPFSPSRDLDGTSLTASVLDTFGQPRLAEAPNTTARTETQDQTRIQQKDEGPNGRISVDVHLKHDIFLFSDGGGLPHGISIANRSITISAETTIEFMRDRLLDLILKHADLTCNTI